MLKENRHSQFHIRFNREYSEKMDCNSLTDISDFFDIPITVLENVFERGAFAFKKKHDCTNERINTPDYHAMCRVYKFVLNVNDIQTGKKRYKKMLVLSDRDLVKQQIDIYSPV